MGGVGFAQKNDQLDTPFPSQLNLYKDECTKCQAIMTEEGRESEKNNVALRCVAVLHKGDRGRETLVLCLSRSIRPIDALKTTDLLWLNKVVESRPCSAEKRVHGVMGGYTKGDPEEKYAIEGQG